MTVITTRSLAKQYDGGVRALDDLSVTIDSAVVSGTGTTGGVVGLVGANGAGKSTFLKIVLGLLPPSSGTIEVLGLDPTVDGELVRARVGYMPEYDCLPPDISAAELVTHFGRISGLPKATARERASETLRHVGLYEERYRQIGGYSTGMKQRVKLAQALVHDPDLLLLDEPTNGLDPAGRDAMLDLVRRIGSEFGITVVICSHLLGEIERICDYLVALDGGKLLRADRVDAMTAGQDELVIEVDDGAEALAELLRSREIAATHDGRTVVVPLVDPRTYDQILDAVADLHLALHRLDQRRHRVAELFARAS
ncbi:ABC transporter ATP-binding protein [Cryptosporangium arvum]|uniref:ABC-type multidrug transport system, ATPase component n=1 Tax=Cryptosporangium arvum DSM 44712 TaxID=927661 RepID=A0A010Z0D9_9ACTN|nr:ABC transporter ATP-binding protein [Cryptosporangium arvum]EXG80918.1 ABC-type multidrug transport system, ATPase component [Cryptosporangium arvum DSM 44712]